MTSHRCFLCSVRIGRQRVVHASFMDGRRHVVRLCYGCGLPDLEANELTLWFTESCAAIDAKLREIKALEV